MRKQSEKFYWNPDGTPHFESSLYTPSTVPYYPHTKSAYDKGYDDVYFYGEYDHDRYRRDKDYAIGVDDALDDWEEFGDDW